MCQAMAMRAKGATDHYSAGGANHSRMRECAQIAGASDRHGKAPLHLQERHMRKH